MIFGPYPALYYLCLSQLASIGDIIDDFKKICFKICGATV
ncbi:hypothetical protein CAMRE0001_1191 [Campylobacter rectus RM3267]|uniref:Uncharacterized protein n=1 Tax=Campylobacter rectus RM3267 TaxID=553218 RepID=B9D0I7_CAMRE|nr:hypothetical protein CAMRE0001_1191 [Campylobacter rectus RM3267]